MRSVFGRIHRRKRHVCAIPGVLRISLKSAFEDHAIFLDAVSDPKASNFRPPVFLTRDIALECETRGAHRTKTSLM